MISTSMAVIYKIKMSRLSITDNWPLTEFYSFFIKEIMGDNTYQNPIGIPNNGFSIWPNTVGFLSYSYEEYDPNTDSIAKEYVDCGLDTLDLINENSQLIYNPNSLTLTAIITFDILENLITFINRCNASWNLVLTKSAVKEYLDRKGITIKEEIYENGVLLLDTGLSCFDLN
jgi:hypothetical protein